MNEPLDAVVIGAGQAGLAMSWHLQNAGARYLTLDAGPRIGHVWRSRWDSLTLFTARRYSALPGKPFPGDPDGHPSKDETADYLAEYARTFHLTVRCDAPVRRLTHDGTFSVLTDTGPIAAHQVVLATGPFQAPAIPPIARQLGDNVMQVHSSTYRRPEDLPQGPVLVVGGGNSGLQIAKELSAAHHVTVALGGPTQEVPQTLLGRDLFWWFTRSGLLNRPAGSHLARRMRARGELIVGTRRAALRKVGVDFVPRAVDADGSEITFANGTSRTVATVVWATGFRADYSWIDVPGVFLDGHTVHRRGVTNVPGLYLLGQQWQHTRGSSRVVAQRVAAPLDPDHAGGQRRTRPARGYRTRLQSKGTAKGAATTSRAVTSPAPTHT